MVWREGQHKSLIAHMRGMERFVFGCEPGRARRCVSGPCRTRHGTAMRVCRREAGVEYHRTPHEVLKLQWLAYATTSWEAVHNVSTGPAQYMGRVGGGTVPLLPRAVLSARPSPGWLSRGAGGTRALLLHTGGCGSTHRSPLLHPGNTARCVSTDTSCAARRGSARR